MESPLNPLSPFKSPLREPINYAKQEPLHQKDKIKWAELSFTDRNCQSETKQLFKLGIPIAFSVATRLLQYLTDQSMVGHLGTDYLAASSMAGILMTIFGTFMYAFCGTINVLCSQAFGAKNLHQVSEWMQLGCVLAAVLSIPSFIGYFYCEQLLLLCGASQHIASLSGKFALWSIFSILPNCQFMAIRNYFKSQSNVLPSMYISGAMIIFNLLINLMLVYGYIISWFTFKIHGTHWNGLGFIGSPIATSITRTTQCSVYIFYMFYWKKYHLTSQTWTSLKLSTFSCQKIKKFFVVAIPQTISSALEDWQIQIISLFAASLNQADLAAFSSSITIVLICHTLTIGVGGAVSVRVANFLGANNPKYAKYVAWVGITLSLALGAVIGGLMAVVGKYLAYVVSGTPEIYRIYAEVFPIIGSAMFILSVFTVVCGVLIAQARTVGLAISALIGCWGISVPMSYLLGIYWDYGIRGIWYGIILGYTIFASATFIILGKTDWEQCAIDAVNRSSPENEMEDGIETNNGHGRVVVDNKMNDEVDDQYLYNSLMSDNFSLNEEASAAKLTLSNDGVQD